MQIFACKVAASLTILSVAGCAQAPEFDDQAFFASGEDAAWPADAGSALDAGPGSTPGGPDTGAVGGLAAGGQLAALGGTGGGPGGSFGGLDSGTGAVDAAADSRTSAPDTSIGAVADTGAGSRDAAQSGPEAGGGTTGGGSTGGGTTGGGTTGGGATCNPASCNNDCFLLERCCDENNVCACLTPLTRQCTLPSL
jgi:hypothetical protein